MFSDFLRIKNFRLVLRFLSCLEFLHAQFFDFYRKNRPTLSPPHDRSLNLTLYAYHAKNLIQSIFFMCKTNSSDYKLSAKYSYFQICCSMPFWQECFVEDLAQQVLSKSSDKNRLKYTELAQLVDTEETLQFLQGWYNQLRNKPCSCRDTYMLYDIAVWRNSCCRHRPAKNKI